MVISLLPAHSRGKTKPGYDGICYDLSCDQTVVKRLHQTIKAQRESHTTLGKDGWPLFRDKVLALAKEESAAVYESTHRPISVCLARSAYKKAFERITEAENNPNSLVALFDRLATDPKPGPPCFRKYRPDESGYGSDPSQDVSKRSNCGSDDGEEDFGD